LLDCLCEVRQLTDATDATLAGRIGSGGCLVYVSGGGHAGDGALLGPGRKGFGRLAVFDMAPDGHSPAALAGTLVFRPSDGRAAAAEWNAMVSN
jgi:hypothetical protein